METFGRNKLQNSHNKCLRARLIINTVSRYNNWIENEYQF